MTEQARNESTKALHVRDEAVEPRAREPRSTRRAYQKPELTLFGSVEEFTRGSGYGLLDANGKNRRAG